MTSEHASSYEIVFDALLGFESAQPNLQLICAFKSRLSRRLVLSEAKPNMILF